MPSLFKDSTDWISAARTRKEVPPHILGTLSHDHFLYNTKFNDYLRSCHQSLLENIEHNFCNAINSDDATNFASLDPCNVFVVPKYFILPPDGSPTLFLTRVRLWVDFLRQDEVRSYWCDVEGVGILSRTEVDTALPFKSLTGFMKVLPKALLESLQPVPGIRMSRTSDKYIGGPISLVNHACKIHANCHFNYNTCCLEAEDFIGRNQKLRYVYNSSEEELFMKCGFKCFVCLRYFVSLQYFTIIRKTVFLMQVQLG